ncbi:MAG: NADP(H)-dependent aldo-keto reductase [Alphaproteobacteria bacterium]
MQYRPLGRSGLRVSAICLGTMTWGQQNDEAEAHGQLDRAIDAGVNFIDTAEMYPVPPMAETQGRTEAHVGSWLAARGRRDRVILATKVVGAGRDMAHFRDGSPRLDRANIDRALTDSLRRLRTDYVDLYQVHWPDRPTNTFGQLGYRHAPDGDAVPIEETLGVLARHVEAGRIRHVGVSNETPWGLYRYLRAAETAGLPRPVSIQNAYSLLNRTFEVGLAEMAIREECGLLAYSPLAGGTLSAKYLDGARPEGARMTLFPRFRRRYETPRAAAAVAAYAAIARRHGLDPAQMALAWIHSRPFTTATIIGATTTAQLDANIASLALTLSAEVTAEIEAVQAANPDPCP